MPSGNPVWWWDTTSVIFSQRLCVKTAKIEELHYLNTYRDGI